MDSIVKIISCQGNHYLVQYSQEQSQKSQQLLDAIISILSKSLHDKIIRDQQPTSTGGFFAPFQNYYTTFSTTITSLITKLGIVQHPSDITRIEKIFATPQDPQIYKFYSSIAHYKMELNHTADICKLHDAQYFNPL